LGHVWTADQTLIAGAEMRPRLDIAGNGLNGLSQAGILFDNKGK